MENLLQRIKQNLGNTYMLGQWTEGRNNNLDALRLIGAAMVIFAHSFPINDLPNIMPAFYVNHYGLIGVGIFLIISGFLITQSYIRSQDPVRFIWARFLRIFPALIVVTLFLAFILGPWLTTLSPSEYFSHPWTSSYVRGAISLYEVTRFTVLPGVFMSNPIVQVNGPLWTLQYEWSFYLVILALGMATLLQRKGFILSLFVASLILTYMNLGGISNLYWTPVHFIPMFFMYFIFGALAYLYRDQIPMTSSAFLFVLLILAIASLKNGLDDHLFVFFLGYVVLYMGFSPKIHLSWLTKYGDFSYGLYIWGWPVQQTVHHFLGNRINVWGQIFISLSIALLFAIFSWHFIEKRLLKLKNMRFDLYSMLRIHNHVENDTKLQ